MRVCAVVSAMPPSIWHMCISRYAWVRGIQVCVWRVGAEPREERTALTIIVVNTGKWSVDERQADLESSMRSVLGFCAYAELNFCTRSDTAAI